MAEGKNPEKLVVTKGKDGSFKLNKGYFDFRNKEKMVSRKLEELFSGPPRIPEAEITKKQFELLSADVDETTIAAVTIFNKRYSEQVHSFLFSQNVNEVRLPPEYLGKPFNEIFSLIEKRKANTTDEIARINAELEKSLRNHESSA
jgi:hypothetical protein